MLRIFYIYETNKPQLLIDITPYASILLYIQLLFHGKTKLIEKDCHFIRRFYLEKSLLALLVQMIKKRCFYHV